MLRVVRLSVDFFPELSSCVNKRSSFHNYNTESKTGFNSAYVLSFHKANKIEIHNCILDYYVDLFHVQN